MINYPAVVRHIYTQEKRRSIIPKENPTRENPSHYHCYSSFFYLGFFGVVCETFHLACFNASRLHVEWLLKPGAGLLEREAISPIFTTPSTPLY